MTFICASCALCLLVESKNCPITHSASSGSLIRSVAGNDVIICSHVNCWGDTMTGVNLKFFRYIWAVEKTKKAFW
jgi:hypothetical protein